MPSAPRPTFLRRFAGAWRPPMTPDLADMGTAFALDLSLDQPELPADPAAAAPDAVPVAAPWLAWLGRRRGAGGG